MVSNACFPGSSLRLVVDVLENSLLQRLRIAVSSVSKAIHTLCRRTEYGKVRKIRKNAMK